jgi:hypothetical protein
MHVSTMLTLTPDSSKAEKATGMMHFFFTKGHEMTQHCGFSLCIDNVYCTYLGKVTPDLLQPHGTTHRLYIWKGKNLSKDLITLLKIFYFKKCDYGS